ncbi:MAG: ABC transporter ATP-binding protein [Desertimonas sp.]
MTTRRASIVTVDAMYFDPAAAAIRVRGLTKTYGARRAVDGLDFELPRGVVAGFIGPNGAGKTTTMAMLLGLVTPTAGEGSVLGAALDRPVEFLDRVGALIEGPTLYPGLTGRENLRVLATLAGHDTGGIPALLDLVGLDERGADRFGDYSLGMKQRLGIAGALLGDPELLILDEPTNGLDPIGRREVREIIERVAGDGRTVLVSSHLLSEIEQVCDWLIVIERGVGIYAGPAAGITGSSSDGVVRIAPAQPGDLPRLVALLRTGDHDPTADDDHVLVSVPDGCDPRAFAAQLNSAAHEHGVVLAELAPAMRTLEDRYLDLVQGATR